MLEHAFPKSDRFRLCRDEHRSLGITVPELVRRQGLLKAFATRQELRKAIGAGEIWTMQTDQVSVAAASFVELLRLAGRDIPARFDGITPPLPRADFGLVLSYDATLLRPWCLEYRAETRTDLKVVRGLTFRAVLQQCLNLDSERAQSTAEAFAAMDEVNAPSLLH